MAEPVQDKKKFVPDFDIYLDGSQLTGEKKSCVIDVSVDMSLNSPDMFMVTFNNRTAQNKGMWIDSMAREWATVRVDMGYQGDLSTLLNGEVVGHEARFVEDGPTHYTVRGYDFLHRLTRGRYTRSWKDTPDSDIAKEIAMSVGFSVKEVANTPPQEYVLINNQSYLDFLRERARRYNLEVDVDEKKNFYYREPKHKEAQVLELKWELDLVEFSPRLSTAHQVTKVIVKGWDPRTKKEIVGIAETPADTMGGSKDGTALTKKGLGAVETVIVDKPIHKQEEADAMAKAKLLDRQLDLITGEAVCRGDYRIRAGSVVKLSAVGERYSGTYYVTNALHCFHNGGYRTTFNFRRSGIGDGSGKVQQVP